MTGLELSYHNTQLLEGVLEFRSIMTNLNISYFAKVYYPVALLMPVLSYCTVITSSVFFDKSLINLIFLCTVKTTKEY